MNPSRLHPSSPLVPGSRPLVVCAAAGIPALGPSGASAHLRGIARALGAPILAARRADHRGEHGADSALEVLDVDVPAWPSRLGRVRELNELRIARRVAARAAAYAPTLLWERHALYADVGAHLGDVPRVLELNAPLALERARFESLTLPWLARALEQRAVAAAPRVIAVSAWLAAWAKSAGAVDVRHVPNGVEPGAGHRQATRARLGLHGHFVIGFLGSMKRWHGVERLPALLDAVPDAVGLCVGDGPVRIDHPRLLQVGQVPESQVPHYVAAMDIGVAPYTADAPPWFCPLKILAYRAQGTPVVASDVGDCALLTHAGPASGGYCGPDLIEAIAAWRGRRAAPWLRSWKDVVAEALS